MMSWFFDGDKKQHPDFARKGVAPRGPVVVDRGNQFGQYIRRAFLPANGGYDVVKGKLAKNGTPEIVRDVARFQDTGPDYYLYGQPFPVVDEFTIIAKVRRDVTNEFQGILSDKTSGNWSNNQGVSLSLRSDDDRLHLKIGTADTRGDLWSVLDNTIDFYTVVGTWETGNAPTLYVDGEEPGAYSFNVSSSGYDVSTADLAVGSYYTRGSSWTHTGDIEYAFFIEKHLNQEQVRDLTRDPYQVFKPATPLQYYVSSAVGGVTNPKGPLGMPLFRPLRGPL